MNFKVLESAKKLRGGYYTPVEIAAFLAKWACAKHPARILEPSCGDGVFFEALDRVRGLGAAVIDAVELDDTEAGKARRRGGTRVVVHATDFLEWSLARDLAPMYDAAMGNPPFIRYQYLEPEIQERAEAVFDRLKLKFTKHTNAWVPFVIASVAQLRPGGRIAMVVPAEILHVLHAEPLREYLARTCERIVILDPQELWFGQSLQGVVLLLAEKAQAACCADLAIVPIRGRSSLAQDPETYFVGSEFVSTRRLPFKWMPALLAPHERSLLEAARQLKSVRPFKEIASVDVGIVTGANKFFLVPDDVVEKFGLQPWAHPMFGRSAHVQGVVFDQANYDRNRELGLPANFLWLGDAPLSSFPKSVQKYIRAGEAEGLNTRYKCRIRTPWYNVPSVFPAPVGMLKRSHDAPRLTLNKLGVLTTDTAYRIEPREVAASTLVACFVNSLTALTAEVEGRHYGGGVLELVPSEIERVLVPIVNRKGALERLDAAFRAGRPVEQTLVEQDREILIRVGIHADEADLLRAAWSRLRFRRQRAESQTAASSDDSLESGNHDEVGVAAAGRRGIDA